MHKIRANEIDFSYLSYGEGPLLLCLHGFPDSAHTWDALGPRFAEMGYRVVAPFMRGYHPTEIPASNAYAAIDLGQDVLALIGVLGAESAIVIGHDWGALAAYSAANLGSDIISKLVTLAIPHPRSLKPSLKGLWKARHFITFQFRKPARRMLSKNDFSGIDTIYRRWSPGWNFDRSETEYIKKSFRLPGRLDAALGYYWSFREGLFGGRAGENVNVASRKTATPTLTLVGENDGALEIELVKNTPANFTNEYRYEIVPGAGHFLHREVPDIVFDHIAEFIKK